MDTIALIYLLTNTVNGKRYVGFTTNLKATLSRHKNRAGKWDFHLSHSIAKHGWGSFTCEVLASGKDAAYMKDVMEPYFIRELGTFHKLGRGYNMTWGGEGTLGYKRTPEQCAALSRVKSGVTLSPERCRQISEQTRGKNNPNYGKKATPETRERISEGIKRAHKEGRGRREWTPEQREAMAARQRDRPRTPAEIEGCRQRALEMKGKPGHLHTEEHKRHMSQVMTGRTVAAHTRRLLMFANMAYVWIIVGPAGKTYKVGCLVPFCREFGVTRGTIEQTLDPTWVPYRARRCPWTGLSKRPITDAEREHFQSTDQMWEELPREPLDQATLGQALPPP